MALPRLASLPSIPSALPRASRDPWQSQRGRPSHARLDALLTANDHLRAEAYALRAERDADIAAMTPHVRRLEMVAHEYGPTAMASVNALYARLERMGRRDRKPAA